MFTETPLLSPLPTRPIRIVSMPSCSAALSFVCFLRPATLAFAHFFVLAILGDQLRKKWYLRLESIAKHKGFVDSRVNFTTKFMVVNFPSPIWLRYLRTQLKEFVGKDFLQCKIYFLSLFSRIRFFFLEADTSKSYNSKRIFSIARKFGQ